MKRIATILAALLALAPMAFGQSSLNRSADNILGEYEARSGDVYRVRFVKNADATYNCQMFWIEDDIDPKTGKPWTDYRNPDKSLRNRYVHDIAIIEGLKYNAEKQVWDGAKIYDPNRGIRANVTVSFAADGSLKVRGTVLGIGETETWFKLK